MDKMRAMESGSGGRSECLVLGDNVKDSVDWSMKSSGMAAEILHRGIRTAEKKIGRPLTVSERAIFIQTFVDTGSHLN